MPRNRTDPPENHPLYHDTYRLMKAYRDVRWSIEVSCSDLQAEFTEAYGHRLEDCVSGLVQLGANIEGTNIESHARTIVRSRKMLALIDAAVQMMRSKHKKGELYYWILYYSFLSPQEFRNVEEILLQLDKQFQHMSLRTFYVLRQDALGTLSSLLWGYTSKECQQAVMTFSLAAGDDDSTPALA